ncbi:hypothetical protein [Paenibacillus chitinolyticus]|uniref:hypothetical protein n=1 Tax=Paenibacillus chitinolyticus TaxID=79263 RepID=UPI001C484DB9|nr:hypothetical protein [Paenibacillus chitinolyticus]MBV6713614.1 hypothetical protein [Paenibacillus chitinolyticus]
MKGLHVMLGSTYHRSIRYRNGAILLLVLMLGLAGYKGYSVWHKTDLYARAAAEQAAGRDVEAENLYMLARDISTFDYKNDEIGAALSALRPVTELKRLFASLASEIAVTNGGSQEQARLLQAYAAYQAKKTEVAAADESAKKRFGELTDAYKLDEQFAAALAGAKKSLTALLQQGNGASAKEGESAMSLLLQLPASVYKDEKTKRKDLNALFQKYDTARLQTIFNQKSFEEALGEIVRIRQFYSERKVEAVWVLPKAETYVQSTLTRLLDANDVPGFLTHAKTFQNLKELSGSSSKVNAFIQSSLRKQTAKAEQLASAGKFADAIALYKVLGDYKDTGKEIRQTEIRWMTAEPGVLLAKAKDNVRFVQTAGAKGLWGSEAIAAGVTDRGTLVTARLQADGSVLSTEGEIGGGLAVKAVSFADGLGAGKLPVVMLESQSRTRNARYTAYEVDASGLNVLLDVEADGYKLQSAGVLLIRNPAGAGGGAEAVYKLQGKQYALAEVPQQLPDPSLEAKDIQPSELPQQQAETVVRLPLAITRTGSGTAVAEMDGLYVLLTGKFSWKPGNAVVTGTYTGETKILQGDRSVQAYKINVSHIEQ